MKRTFNQLSQSAVYKEDDTSVSLTVCGGSYGGGSEVLVVYAIHEADGQDVTMQKEVAYSLVCGGVNLDRDTLA